MCGATVAVFEVLQVLAGDDRYVKRLNVMSMAGFALVLTTNLVTTGLIAGKLWCVPEQKLAAGDCTDDRV